MRKSSVVVVAVRRYCVCVCVGQRLRRCSCPGPGAIILGCCYCCFGAGLGRGVLLAAGGCEKRSGCGGQGKLGGAAAVVDLQGRPKAVMKRQKQACESWPCFAIDKGKE